MSNQTRHLYPAMEPIAQAKVEAYMTDFTEHDRAGLESAQVGDTYLWTLRSTGTWLVRSDERPRPDETPKNTAFRFELLEAVINSDLNEPSRLFYRIKITGKDGDQSFGTLTPMTVAEVRALQDYARTQATKARAKITEWKAA